MKNVMFAMTIVLAMAGCKKTPAADEAPAVTATPACAEAGEHVQELMLRMTKADAPDAEKSAAFGKSRAAADKVAAACTKDKWTAEAINCVKTTEKLSGCKLSAEQQQALPAL